MKKATKGKSVVAKIYRGARVYISSWWYGARREGKCDNLENRQFRIKNDGKFKASTEGALS
jgi:hypothetical protein